MARKLKGFPAEDAGAAIATEDAPAAADESRWKPYVTSKELPAPKTAEKVRVRELPDGTSYATKTTTFIKAGEPRYSVTQAGELTAHYRKRGGVARKLVYQFKSKFKDTKEGRAQRAKQQAFRAVLRSAGIPGA